MPKTVANDVVAAGSENESRETRQGVLMVVTGPGKGKTTSAFGQALRAHGHGFKIAIVQFMKGRIYGELDTLRSLPRGAFTLTLVSRTSAGRGGRRITSVHRFGGCR